MSDDHHMIEESSPDDFRSADPSNDEPQLISPLVMGFAGTGANPLPDPRIRRAAGTVLVGQTFNVVGMLLSLIAVPLYLQWLGRDGYGLLLTGLAFAGYLTFANVGLSWASIILIAQASGKDDHGKIAAIVRNSISLAFVSVIVVACVAGAVVATLRSGVRLPFFPDDPEFPLLLAVVAASVCLSLISSPFYGLYNGLQRGYIAGVFQGLGRLCGVCAALYTAWSGASVAAVLLANVLVAFLFNVAAAVNTRYQYPWAFVRGPLWQRDQIRSQFRTGIKNFGLQIGGVLVGTAPVLAISSQLGAAAVPLFTVPFMLINLPLSLFFSINSALQSGYGEAHGRGDSAWITRTIRLVLEHLLLAIALLSVGYFFVGADFIAVWTQSKLHVQLPELLSAWLVAVPLSLLGVFRFVLVGLNRQRTAAVSEILFGLLALTLASLAAQRFGIDGVGPAICLAALCTSTWVLPTQVRKAFPQVAFTPELSFIVRALAILVIALVAGAAARWLSNGISRELAIIFEVIAITAAFIVAAAQLLPETYSRIHRLAFDRMLVPIRDRIMRRSGNVNDKTAA
ncbi:MAG: lipopolysaccharide biosynthesis protein [Pirellulales bacterium]